MRVSVHNGCRHTTVVVEEIVVPSSIHIGNGTATTPVGTAITDIFRRLRGSLAQPGTDLSKTTLALPEGGKLPIPSAFSAWAKQKGMQIILCSDAVPQQLARKIEDKASRRNVPPPLVKILDELG
jgi:hypothetical protein